MDGQLSCNTAEQSVYRDGRVWYDKLNGTVFSTRNKRKHSSELKTQLEDGRPGVTNESQR